MLLIWLAYLPMGLFPLLEVLNLSPGIQGFDTYDAGDKPFHPIWFNIVGAILIVAGLFPILASLEEPALEMGGTDRA